MPGQNQHTQKAISNLVQNLEIQRETFLSGVSTDIHGFISQQGAQCLTIVGRSSRGRIERTWKLAASFEYINCLVAFSRQQSYQGLMLDSGLTEPVVQKVIDRYESFYRSNNELISQELLQALLQDKTAVRCLTSTIVESVAHSMKGISSIVCKQASELLEENLQTLLDTSTGHMITSTTSHVVSAAISAPIVHTIAALIVKFLSTKLGMLIIKVLSTTALKGIIAAIIKKFVVTAVIGAIIKAVAAKFGLSTVGAITVVLLPIIAAYISYEIITFPDHLGQKVADQVTGELRSNFAETNANVLMEIFKSLAETSVNALGKEIAKQPEIQRSVAELLVDLSS